MRTAAGLVVPLLCLSLASLTAPGNAGPGAASMPRIPGTDTRSAAGNPVAASSAPTAAPTRGVTVVPPVRLLDTVAGVGTRRGPVAAGRAVRLSVGGRVGVPSSAGAAVLSVTVARTAVAGALLAVPPGVRIGTGSVVRWGRGGGVSTTTMVPLRSGVVNLVNASRGPTNVTVDLLGWVAGGAASGGPVPVVAQRVLDTAVGVGARRAPVLAGRAVAVVVAGRSGIPPTAAAVLLAVSVTAGALAGRVMASATGSALPRTGGVAFDAGRVGSGLLLVRPGRSGSVTLTNLSRRPVNLHVSVVGWLRSGRPRGGGVAMVTPTLLLDTLTGVRTVRRPLGAAKALGVTVVGTGGVPRDAIAVLLTLTASRVRGSGRLVAYADGRPRPTGASLRVGPAVTSSSTVLAPVGRGGRVLLWNASSGAMDVTVTVVAFVVRHASSDTPAVGPAVKSLPLTAATMSAFLWDDEQLRQQLTAWANHLCRPTSEAIPTPSRAVAAAQAVLAARESPAALAAFRTSASAASVEESSTAAAAATAAGRPGAALAALLRAHELDPSSASHLQNAAGILVSLGHPGVALGVLDAAAATGTRGNAPMQMSPEAMAASTRGTALFLLGRYDEADAAFALAQSLDVDLSEAVQGRAMVALCRGQLDTAVALYRQGARRGLPAGTAMVGDPRGVNDNTEDDWEQPDPAIIPQPVHGSIQLPRLDLPTTLPQLHANRRGLNTYFEGLVAQAQDLKQQADRLRASAAPRSPATQRRENDLWTAAMLAVELSPAMADLNQEYAALQARYNDWWGRYYKSAFATMDRFRRECEGSDDPYCVYKKCNPHYSALFAEWSSLEPQRLETVRAMIERRYRIATGIATNVGDSQVQQALLLDIQADAVRAWAYDGVLDVAHYAGMSHGEADECFQVASPSEEELDPVPAGGTVPPCPPELDQYKPGFALGPVTINFDCSTVEVELATPGFLGYFVSTTYDYRARNVTLFVGVHGTLTAYGTDTSLSTKAGFFVKVDDSGVRDGGLRLSADVTIGKGFVVKPTSGELTIGVVSGISVD